MTEEEVAYFRDHPDEIDEFTAPVNIRKLFLWAGALLGSALAGLSKALKYAGLEDIMSQAFSEFVVDIITQIPNIDDDSYPRICLHWEGRLGGLHATRFFHSITE